MTESHRSGSHVPWDRPLSQWLACKPLEMLDLQPNFVFFGNQQDITINEVISNFNLNTKQTLAFRIIAEHTLGSQESTIDGAVW